jgi:hypothetical protein
VAQEPLGRLAPRLDSQLQMGRCGTEACAVPSASEIKCQAACVSHPPLLLVIGFTVISDRWYIAFEGRKFGVEYGVRGPQAQTAPLNLTRECHL